MLVGLSSQDMILILYIRTVLIIFTIMNPVSMIDGHFIYKCLYNVCQNQDDHYETQLNNLSQRKVICFVYLFSN